MTEEDRSKIFIAIFFKLWTLATSLTLLYIKDETELGIMLKWWVLTRTLGRILNTLNLINLIYFVKMFFYVLFLNKTPEYNVHTIKKIFRVDFEKKYG